MKKPNDTAKNKLPVKSMSQQAKVTIRKLPTGVRGLDDIIGGGIPEYSFNIIAGPPGGGKTTTAQKDGKLAVAPAGSYAPTRLFRRDSWTVGFR